MKRFFRRNASRLTKTRLPFAAGPQRLSAKLSVLIAVPFVLGTASVFALSPVDNQFTYAGSLHTARRNHTATLLANGNVLMAGGNNFNDGYLSSTELYDPVSGSWGLTALVGSLNTARADHTATLLPNGKVLVAGGYTGSDFLTSAELYEPASGNWRVTDNLNTEGRAYHTATLLPNGKVLVAGGYQGGSSPWLTTAELYDPATGTWTVTGSLNTGRFRHTATLLRNGKVLVVGGIINGGFPASAELYDPASGTWTATAGRNTVCGFDTATLLPNAKLLAAGGWNGASLYLGTGAELYDPASGTWTATGNLNAARWSQMATLLPNGNVLVAGGQTVNNGYVSVAELYDAATGRWIATGGLISARAYGTATLLPNGKVLVAAGQGYSGILASAEVYDPTLVVVSRKTHGAAGDFDINLPLTGTPATECRAGGPTNDYQLALTFPNSPIITGTPQAQVTSGTGDVGSNGTSNGGAVAISGNIMTVPLTNVANAQTIKVTLFGVNGAGNLVIPMSVLVGDTNANSAVNAGDVSQTKSRIGETIDPTNFRSDVNADGSINASDVSFIKARIGTGLP